MSPPLILPPYDEPPATTGNVPWPPEGFHWTGTGGITDFQSYAWVLHNAVYYRLASSTFFQGFTVKRISEALPIEGTLHLPFLGVYEGEEPMVSDGPINMSDIGFRHTVNIGIQVVLQDNNTDTLLQRLDQAYWFIMNRIWRDDTFTNRIWTLLPDNLRIEGVVRVRKRRKWGASAARNETPVGMIAVEAQLQFLTFWAPTDFANLEMITVTTAFPPGGTAEDQAAIQQIKAVYTFEAEQQRGVTSNGKPAGTRSGNGSSEPGSSAPPGAVEADAGADGD